MKKLPATKFVLADARDTIGGRRRGSRRSLGNLGSLFQVRPERAFNTLLFLLGRVGENLGLEPGTVKKTPPSPLISPERRPQTIGLGRNC